MNSFNFQIVPVANLAAIVTPFPDHICYFTEDTEKYYIWENNALKEIFADTTSLTWNNITNKPTTISGFGITDAVKANNGTVNYVSKFTPDGTTIGNSFIQDDGSGVGLCNSPSTLGKISAISSDKDIVFWLQNPKIGGTNTSLFALTNGSSTTNIGVVGKAQNGTTSNYGVQGIAASAGLINYGISGEATGGLTNIGIRSYVEDGANNYVAWLQKAPESVQNSSGKFLKSITGDGKANWANINITEVTNGLSSTLLGAPNGIATLDNNSKLVMSQMPITVMDYKGTYDIVTNVPVLVDGTGNQGDVYVNTAAGTRTFGPGNTITVGVGDWLIYNGTKWEKTLGNNVGSGTVNSVGLSLGTTGTDVNVSNSPITTSGNINLNIPTASASARGLLSAANWTEFNNKIGGSGTLNFLPKFSPNGSTLGNSQIFDNGINIGVNTTPTTTCRLTLVAGANEHGIRSFSTTANYAGLYGANYTNGSGNNIGVIAEAQNSTSQNIGIQATASGFSTIGAQLFSSAASSGTSIGLQATANSVSGDKYSVQLQDGTQGTGKFLKSVTTDGKANWANITAADVSGAVGAVGGTNNYLAKFTPNGTTLGNSQIIDDGTLIGIGTTTRSDTKVIIEQNQRTFSLMVNNQYTSTNPTDNYIAITASSVGSGSGARRLGVQAGAAGAAENTGVLGYCMVENITKNGTGVDGYVRSAFTGIGVNGRVTGNTVYGFGGMFTADSTGVNSVGVFSRAFNSTNNYCFQGEDGTQAQNKFLKAVTADGKANWAYLPDSAQIMCSDMTNAITADASNPKAIWAAPCNGQLTDAFATLRIPQSGGVTFTVLVKSSLVTLATLTFSNGNLQFMSTNPTATQTFTKGDIFEFYVSQVGDGTARSLLVTLNYLRT
jgi:hypothetical protein